MMGSNRDRCANDEPIVENGLCTFVPPANNMGVDKFLWGGPPRPTLRKIHVQPSAITETKCEKERRETLELNLIGSKIPRCNDDGSYKWLQVWGSTGGIWCVDKNGVEREGLIPVRSLSKIDCQDPELCCIDSEAEEEDIACRACKAGVKMSVYCEKTGCVLENEAVDYKKVLSQPRIKVDKDVSNEPKDEGMAPHEKALYLATVLSISVLLCSYALYRISEHSKRYRTSNSKRNDNVICNEDDLNLITYSMRTIGDAEMNHYNQLNHTGSNKYYEDEY